MTKAVRILALGLMTAGLVLVVQYIGAMNANIRLNSQLKDGLDAAQTTQTAQTAAPTYQPISTEVTTPSSLETIATSPLTSETIATTPLTSETIVQKTDPFAGLRQPTWPTVSSPLISLYEQNNDLVGWIKIADTRIDYPIVKGKDNEYYLERGFDRKTNRAGSIFMDYRNIGDGQDGHTIIYGHRMKNKTMFADLVRFKDSSFYDKHRIIAIDTLYGRKEYKVFAAYTTSTDFYFIETRFDAISRQAFFNEIKKRSQYKWDVTIGESDRILTLVTCAYDFEDARFVVHAMLLNR